VRSLSKDYPFADDWPLSPSRFRLFLKRHRQSLSLVGALIVFSTFVIKDAIRQDVKDTVDSLQAAEDVFVTRSENQAAAMTLASIKAYVENLSNKTDSALDYLDDELSGVQEMVLQGKRNLDNLKRMIDKLPGTNAPLISSLHKLEGNYDAVFESTKTVSQGVADGLIRMERRAERIAAVGNQTSDLLIEIQTFADKVIETSDEVRKAEERKYRRYTMLSYFLYAIGWSLALFGRLFGMDSMLEES
jgi:ABC-type transporter Mla subunit MlaD